MTGNDKADRQLLGPRIPLGHRVYRAVFLDENGERTVRAFDAKERVFDNRTLYVGELRNLGAKIITGGQTVIVEGGGSLSGAAVRALDIRAGAAVVIGGLAASGETEIGGIEHLDRGYAHLAERLNAVGADVARR